MSEETQKFRNPHLKAWRCTGCFSVIGFVEDKKVVRIKRRDVYVETEGGRTKVICTNCGKDNEIIDTEFKSEGIVPLKEGGETNGS